MSEKNLKVGQKVEIIGKDVRGLVAYIGMTSFAVGKWVGVVLDEPKGKNNGTIKGNTYFTCPENYGMFVRTTQLVVLDDAGNPIEDMSTSIEEKPKGRLSSSRISLAGSRQSLAGSRSQLASPATDRAPSSIPVAAANENLMKKSGNNAMSPPETIGVAKRASFIETGFLETLKPQFTAGQSLISPSPAAGVEEKINAMQQQQEMEELRGQVKDLSEKLETLKQRRAEDKERYREFDKMKMQYEQLQEFKTKIMDAQTQLQRDLQRAKQDAKDAIEARDLHIEEMSELAENAELITLDKEMAEEKSDTLQLELDQAKERIEELTLDLEILKTEMQDRCGSTIVGGSGSGADGGGITTYEFKQLEQQNTRLRETLVRMRDLSAHEKHENQKLLKELETKKSEVAELQRTKEKLSAKIDELEAQVVDLQEQVDAALGAEEMVEQLAEKKMELEDRCKLLEEEVAELEALEEVHEQLVESNHELELDLREELDMAHAAKREAAREKDAAFETIIDRDQTILKFRELVQKLNDQAQELREKMNQESSKMTTSNSGSNKDTNLAETIDFKQMFAESKAYTRAIDLQLRQIELAQSNEHVRYLMAYMPDTFMARGGDHDAIQVILLVSRIVFKAGIVVSQARERFPAVTQIDRNTILQGHTIHQFSFRSRLLHHIHNLQSTMHQFLFGLSACTPETLLKIGASIPEMVAQEKTIDYVVELLKVNQMDEHSSTESLEKTVTFFNAMYSLLLANENLLNETQIVRDCIFAIGAACDSIGTDAAIIQSLIKISDATTDSGLLMQYVIQTVDTIKQQLKLVKRRLPQDISITKCKLSQNTLQNLKVTVEALNKIMSVLFMVSKGVLHLVTVNTETEVSITHEKLWEILSNACEKVYETDDRGPSQNIRNVLSITNTDMSQIAQYLLENEYEIMAAPTEKDKPTPPIVLRAQSVKKQLEETKTLTATLENREAEIRQLKLEKKLKQNELSEMQIRKDLAEKKLSVLQQDYEVNVTKLQKQYEEVSEQLHKKEKEFEETLDHLQTDIDSLEEERSSMRVKLKAYGTKTDFKSAVLEITAGSPYIAQELTLLKKAFNNERSERLQLQANEYKKILQNLEPIYIPKPKDNRIDELEKELYKVKYDYVMSLVRGAEMPSSNTTRANLPKLINDHQNKQKILRSEIKMKAESLASEIIGEYLDRKPYRSVKGDFSKFPSNEVSRAFKENVRV